MAMLDHYIPDDGVRVGLGIVHFYRVAARGGNACLRLGNAAKTLIQNEQYDDSMDARLQHLRLEIATVIERAQRVMGESRNLLRQRENQLRQMEQFLEQNPRIADKPKTASPRIAVAVPPEIGK